MYLIPLRLKRQYFFFLTSTDSGVISTQWTAPSAGLYSIQVSIPGTDILSSSLTAP